MGTEVLIAATAVQAYSSIRQGQAAKEAGEYNARQAEEAAAQTREQMIQDERQLRAMARKHIGETRASYGAGGVTMEGSPMAVLEESAANAEADAQAIKRGGMARASAYERDAAMSRRSGSNAETTGYFGAAGSLLQGASKYYEQYGGASKKKSEV